MERQRAIDESQRDYRRLFVALTCRVTRGIDLSARFISAGTITSPPPSLSSPRVATLRQIVRENTIYFPRTAMRALSANCSFSLIRTVRIGITRVGVRARARAMS